MIRSAVFDWKLAGKVDAVLVERLAACLPERSIESCRLLWLWVAALTTLTLGAFGGGGGSNSHKSANSQAKTSSESEFTVAPSKREQQKRSFCPFRPPDPNRNDKPLLPRSARCGAVPNKENHTLCLCGVSFIWGTDEGNDIHTVPVLFKKKQTKRPTATSVGKKESQQECVSGPFQPNSSSDREPSGTALWATLNRDFYVLFETTRQKVMYENIAWSND
jgi:hypothetical protein